MQEINKIIKNSLKAKNYPIMRLVTDKIEQIPSDKGIFLSLGILADGMKRYAVILHVNTAKLYIEEITATMIKDSVAGVLSQIENDQEWEAAVNSAYYHNLITVERLDMILQKFKDQVDPRALKALEEYRNFLKIKSQEIYEEKP